jgi:hypothetical protein
MMTSKNIYRPLIQDDILDQAVHLLVSAISQFICPILDPSHRPRAKAAVPEDGEGQDVKETKKKKRGGKTSLQTDEKRFWKQMASDFQFVKVECFYLMNRFSQLISTERMRGTHLQTLTNVMFNYVFKSEILCELQMMCSPVIITIFKRADFHYGSGEESKNFRMSIVNDLVNLFRSHQPSKKNLRTFNIVHPSGSSMSTTSIQMLTALALQLIQSLTSFTITDLLSSAEVSDLQTAIAMPRVTVMVPPEKKSRVKKGKGRKGKKGKAAAREPSPPPPPPTLNPVLLQFKNILEERQKLAAFFSKYFVKHLLDRLIRPQCVFSTLKSVLANLVTDLLTVLYRPELPAAELLLLILGQVFYQRIRAPSKDEPATLRTLAISLLGRIVAHLKTQLLLAEENPLVIRERKTNVDQTANPVSKGEDNSCCCNWKKKALLKKLKARKLLEDAKDKKEDKENKDKKEDKETKDEEIDDIEDGEPPQGLDDADPSIFWLDCDSCHVWFHGACVGMTEADVLHVNAKDAPPWFCDSCHIRQAVEQNLQRQGKAAPSGASEIISAEESEVLHQVLINHLNESMLNSDEHAQFAKHYHLGQMVVLTGLSAIKCAELSYN